MVVRDRRSKFTVNAQEPPLKIRFDGKSMGPGRIPVTRLLRFLGFERLEGFGDKFPLFFRYLPGTTTR